jgi:hypothetical protein
MAAFVSERGRSLLQVFGSLLNAAQNGRVPGSPGKLTVLTIAFAKK